MSRPNKPNDSLKKRYLYKLFSGFFGFIFNLVSQAIIPRGLGPEVYGNYNFLTNFFTQLTSFVDAGTSTCFYTKLSQRPKEQRLVSFYFLFGGLIFILTVLCIAIMVAANIYPIIWPGQELLFICLALGLGFLMWFAQIVNQMTDAYGLTVPAELLKMLQKFLGLLILVWLYVTSCLNFGNFFAYNYVILAMLLFLLIALIGNKGYLEKGKFGLSASNIKSYTSEFWKYSHPLFTCSLVVFICGIFDRWILQVYSGSAQQGFYSLSYQVGAVCFLFTGAMSPLFMRELSIAHVNNDLEGMKRMFRRYMPILYAITAYFSCFIAVMADKAVHIFGGSRFSGAIIPVAIMAFYPIHQTYGQLSSSVFYATSQTRIYRNISILFSLLGVPVTYLLIAPHDNMGLDAGAVGLAAKMVLINILGVNVQLYFNAKHLRFNYWNYLWHQVITVGIFLGLAVSADLIVIQLLRFSGSVVTFFISGVIYSALVAAVVYMLPEILGVKRGDIFSFIEGCKKRLGAPVKI